MRREPGLFDVEARLRELGPSIYLAGLGVS
jgi:hypothetical protein